MSDHPRFYLSPKAEQPLQLRMAENPSDPSLIEQFQIQYEGQKQKGID